MAPVELQVDDAPGRMALQDALQVLDGSAMPGYLAPIDEPSGGL